MPKIVDHEQRKKLIAKATWRVIVDKGMEGATVRNIAKEAGISLGALRHYFSSQEQLLRYAMNLVKEQVTARINNIVQSDLPPKEKVLQILLEIVPIDQESRAEMEVWFAFTFYSLNKWESFDAQHDGLYQGIKNIIDNLDELGLLRPGVDNVIETERLYALVDGIAMHALLDPQRVNKQRIEQVFRYHLEAICQG